MGFLIFSLTNLFTDHNFETYNILQYLNLIFSPDNSCLFMFIRTEHNIFFLLHFFFFFSLLRYIKFFPHLFNFLFLSFVLVSLSFAVLPWSTKSFFPPHRFARTMTQPYILLRLYNGCPDQAKCSCYWSPSDLATR